jgi:medium-chain acyl-[acyl-carrier-protein] hydrolase
VPVWHEPFRVHFYDAEPGGRASIPALCRYLEAAADSHCRPLNLSISQLRETGRTWVLSRFALRVHAFPRLHDSVTVETWATNRSRGVRAYRDFRIVDTSGQVLAQASSLWFLLDTKTRRPMRLPESVLNLSDTEPLYRDLVDARRLIQPKHVLLEDRISVEWSDLDLNGHANNISYIEWVLNTLPVEVLREATLTELDIHFVSEVLLGEKLISVCDQTGPSDTPSFRHRLATNDGRELARARTDWRYLDDAEADTERSDAA